MEVIGAQLLQTAQDSEWVYDVFTDLCQMCPPSSTLMSDFLSEERTEHIRITLKDRWQWFHSHLFWTNRCYSHLWHWASLISVAACVHPPYMVPWRRLIFTPFIHVDHPVFGVNESPLNFDILRKVICDFKRQQDRLLSLCHHFHRVDWDQNRVEHEVHRETQWDINESRS